MKKSLAVILLALALGLLGAFGLLGAGCEVSGNNPVPPTVLPTVSPTTSPTPTPGTFEMFSTAFASGDEIPLENASTLADPPGENISPPFTWENPPEGTTHYVLTMVDTTFPLSHWIVVNIPVSSTGLAAGAGDSDATLPAGAFHVINEAGGAANYEGPFPPANETHTYTFTLYALSEQVTGIDENSTLAEVQAAIADITLDSVTYTGTYVGPDEPI